MFSKALKAPPSKPINPNSDAGRGHGLNFHVVEPGARRLWNIPYSLKVPERDPLRDP